MYLYLLLISPYNLIGAQSTVKLTIITHYGVNANIHTEQHNNERADGENQQHEIAVFFLQGFLVNTVSKSFIVAKRHFEFDDLQYRNKWKTKFKLKIETEKSAQH